MWEGDTELTRGGNREGSGRKKIGIVINTRIEKETINEIDNKIEGNNRAEKIRKCLKVGLENWGKKSE